VQPPARRRRDLRDRGAARRRRGFLRRPRDHGQTPPWRAAGSARTAPPQRRGVQLLRRVPPLRNPGDRRGARARLRLRLRHCRGLRHHARRRHRQVSGAGDGANIMPTMVMSALVDRVPRKAMTYLVWSTALVSALRAREAGIVSEVFPAAELDAAADVLCAQIMRAPRPARVGCKDYARAALDMDVTGAIEYARSIHAVINSSSEMLPSGHK